MKIIGLGSAAAVALMIVALTGAGHDLASAAARLSDSQIKQRMISESIASYPGNCPCPYNSARNGSSCGGRSAWSRGGGYAPLCYPADISRAQVDTYRRSHGIP